MKTPFPRLRLVLASAMFCTPALLACASTAGGDMGGAAPISAMQPAAGEQLLPARLDPQTGRVFLTIPRMGEEVLYLNTLAAGLGMVGLDRGEVGLDAIVRFERHGARVFMVRQNTTHRAVDASPELRASVDESFPRSVLASFAVHREGPEGVVIDATDFFLSDMFDVVGRLRGARQGSMRLDRERSFVSAERSGSYQDNTEVRAVLTFGTDDPGPVLRRHSPDGRSVTLEQHHSFVRLPTSPLAVRRFDPRAGLFAATFFDFAQGLESDYRQRGVVRWRLEPSDTSAYLRGELVEPLRPIVYYLDPAIPEPYRTAFHEGGMWWNQVLEAAGWRNAFRIEPLPQGADPIDARYPMIHWVHRQQRGPSVGPTFRDPRTGEVITTVVRMDSYRSLVDHDIYMGLVPSAGAGGLQMGAEEFSMARRRQHTAHEIGHTLGLAHNFIAATQNRSSVMDYPYPLITLDARGELDISHAYRASGGAHDTLAIRYAYTWYPDPESEREGLRQLVRDAEAGGLRFIGDAHAGAAGSYPAASVWVEGSDMLGALERTMAVRRVLIDRFDGRAAQEGEPLAVLNRRFAHVYLHHRYALTGAVKAVGGMEFGYALAGEATEPTRVLPAAEQRQALRMVLSALQPAQLRIPERVTSMIPPVPPGFDSDLTLIPSAAGAAFDPLGTGHSLAQEIVDGLLHPERAARLVSLRARDAGTPGLEEVLTALTAATWGAPVANDPMSQALQRVGQRAALDGMLDLAGSENATSEVRIQVEQQLEALRQALARQGSAPASNRAHRETALRDLERYFRGEDDIQRRPRPAPITLPWP